VVARVVVREVLVTHGHSNGQGSFFEDIMHSDGAAPS
jgi:hypothetical protein